jgi:ABC-type multidrug transport system ATPase subunit
LLDEEVAEAVVASLSHLAHKYQRTIISSIHQPSWQVFQHFDKSLLLNKGRVVYHGDANMSIVHYFSSVGYEPPELDNPLTYYVRQLAKESETDLFANAWDGSKHKTLVDQSALAELPSNLKGAQVRPFVPVYYLPVPDTWCLGLVQQDAYARISSASHF